MRQCRGRCAWDAPPRTRHQELGGFEGHRRDRGATLRWTIPALRARPFPRGSMRRPFSTTKRWLLVKSERPRMWWALASRPQVRGLFAALGLALLGAATLAP